MFEELQPLLWIVAGFLLIVTEFFVSGLVIAFFGTAAIATGLAVWLGLPTSYGIPFYLFTVLTLGQIYFLRGVFEEWFYGDSVAESPSAQNGDEFIGKEAEVVSGFEDGSRNGRVAFRGTEWTARSGADLAPGQLVIIENREGHTLHVVPISKDESL